jgi:hypothetical protein
VDRKEIRDEKEQIYKPCIAKANRGFEYESARGRKTDMERASKKDVKISPAKGQDKFKQDLQAH